MSIVVAAVLLASLHAASPHWTTAYETPSRAMTPPPGDVIRVRGIRGDTVVNLLPSEGGGRVRLDVMAQLLGGSADSVAPQRWRLELSGAAVEVEAGAPFASYNGFTLPLLESTIVHEGAAYVPLQLFSEIIPRFGVGVLWDRTRWEVRLFQSIARREQPQSPAAQVPATPTIPVSNSPVPVSASPTQVPAPPVTANTPPSPVRATSPSATPSAETAPSVPPSAAPSAPASNAGGASSRTRVPTADAPRGLSRRYTVAVDAGHGGVDPGNPGVVLNGRRINESRLTLAMAKRLESELRSRGLDVVMTRDADTLIARDDRGPIANQRRADLFISLHTNAANPNWRNGSAVRGVETYFLATARTEDERRVAAMENDVVRFETTADPDKDDPLAFILNDIAQNEHLRESADLAQLVQQSLAAKHPGTNRGVKQAGFAVLARAYMPAVLVEVGFGTNAADAAWMNSIAGQRVIAESIADAVWEYILHYERRTRTVGR